MADASDAAPSLEEQVAILKQQLEHERRFAALGELLSTTTHEFNNILTTVINYSKMGMRHRDDPTRDKAFEKIHSASLRAARITRSILGMARNRGNQLESTDLAEIVDDALVLLEREMRKYRVAVELEIDPSTPTAMANGNQIQRVLLNRLINARQSMPEGGTILIRLAPCSEGGLVELVVRDSGSGIPRESLPHIFDAFYSTKDGPDESGKGGTGLGLAACKEIIDSHQGRIRVESTVGRGTAFIIRLPESKGSQAAA
jgi:signal transduction histidine kinase